MFVNPMSAIAFSVFSLTNPSSDLNSVLSGTATSAEEEMHLIKWPNQLNTSQVEILKLILCLLIEILHK